MEVQKNVNKIAKDGVKDIVLWIEHMEEDHQEIIGKETAYQHREERYKVLNRAQAHDQYCPPKWKSQP